MMDNFKDVPKSIAELRSEREQDANKWTPRDALVSLLRDIDAGEINPEEMVIVWSDDATTRWRAAGSDDRRIVLGMLEQTKWSIQS